MAENIIERHQDAEEHLRTYKSIMKATGEIGVPFAMALTVFFTNLVLANGFWLSLFAGVLTYLAVFWIVRLFFSH